MKRSSRTPAEFTDSEWHSARDQLRAAIVAAARAERLTYYSEVAVAVDAIDLQPHSFYINQLLGEIFEEEFIAGYPPLTAIVTYKHGGGPGPGFYGQARALGYDVRSEDEFWLEQVQLVFEHHRP